MTPWLAQPKLLQLFEQYKGMLCMNIAADKRDNQESYFLLSQKHVVGTHQKRLGEVLRTNTHNTCFCGEKRKISAISG